MESVIGSQPQIVHRRTESPPADALINLDPFTGGNGYPVVGHHLNKNGEKAQDIIKTDRWKMAPLIRPQSIFILASYLATIRA
jgi:hypothetical protein